jgi:L-threonylcarbamoyladenylate synthase
MRLSESELRAAVMALEAGEVIGLPTETVYGLAADGTNPEAVRKIFVIKGRPAAHPLILHLGDISWLSRFTLDAPQAAFRLAEAFWPGPLSLVLKRSDAVPDEVTGGLATVAVRVPSHPVALQVLRALDRPLAAPSANRFGEVSPTTKAHVLRDLGGEVSLVLDGGASEVGVESTIVDLSSEKIRILRPGGVSAEEIESVLALHLEENDGSGPAAPGTLEAHYAPRAEVRLVAADELWRVAERCLESGQIVGVFAREVPPLHLAEKLAYRSRGDGRDAAHHLYAVLRDLDELGSDVILAPLYEGDALDQAVSDRLRRAAVGSRRLPK